MYKEGIPEINIGGNKMWKTRGEHRIMYKGGIPEINIGGNKNVEDKR